MAHRDSSTGQLVLRLVLDGPPLAGKTTTLQALSELLGEPIIRGDGPGGRTETLDWVEHAGGVFEGQRIRFQLVAVPGQEEHDRRRRRLLRDADVVVLVIDSTREGLAAGLAHLSGPVPAAGGGGDDGGDGGGAGPRPMVVQANKQDLPDAAGAAEVEEAVRRVAMGVDVVPTSAVSADGLRMLLAVAVRRALQHVRAKALPLPSALPATYEDVRRVLDEPEERDEHEEPEVGGDLAPAPAGPQVAVPGPQPAEAPREAPSMDAPPTVEEPAVMDGSAVVEEPAVVDGPAVVEEPAVVDGPAVVEEPAAFAAPPPLAAPPALAAPPPLAARQPAPEPAPAPTEPRPSPLGPPPTPVPASPPPLTPAAAPPPRDPTPPRPAGRATTATEGWLRRSVRRLVAALIGSSAR